LGNLTMEELLDKLIKLTEEITKLKIENVKLKEENKNLRTLEIYWREKCGL